MERLQPYWEAVKRFWRNRHITQILLLLLLTFILLSILFFAIMAATANVQSLKDGLSQSTVIYDKDGDVASKLSMSRTEGVQVNELPEHVTNAVIAIEDRRFYEHNGFDIKGIIRVFFKNLFAGRITGGGSTITQQLTKNALLSPEQTIKRKVQELFLAVEIEKNYKKDEILQMYLSHVYFGSGAWGMDNAANKYFNKDLKDVTISEAAMLAGLLQAPSALDPYKHYERALQRRDVVLSQMKELEMISDSEYKGAKQEIIRLDDGGGSRIKRKYPYYVDAVLDEATTVYGLTQDEILTRGYRIYTELDQNIQTSLEKVYERNYLFPSNRDGTLVQSGAVLLDPKSGGVRGLVGGRGEHVFRGFNRATHVKAQPGSTMKPLAVYTPALEEGYTPTSTLVDKPMNFGNYTPTNFSKTYKGEVPMYEAVQDSLNLPAVWLLNEIGVDKGLDSIRRFGITLEKDDKYLGVALGGTIKGVSPLKMAEAYSTFPNGGKRNDGHLITKIVGPTGNVIAERKKKVVKVTSKSVANEMTSMLLNVVESGTGREAKISGTQMAGKSGSTQLPYKDISGTKDQWFIGYTPNLVGAVWLGYDKTDRQHYLPSSSSETVVPIFKAMMESALPHIDNEDFAVQSINARLAGKKPKTEQILKEKTEKLEKKLSEEAPKWKNRLDQAVEQLKKVDQKIREKMEEYISK